MNTLIPSLVCVFVYHVHCFQADSSVVYRHHNIVNCHHYPFPFLVSL